MAESLPFPDRGRWRPGARFAFRTGRRTLVESLYLLTGPAIAAAGLALVLGGLCLGSLRPARWVAELERWRIARVRSAAAAITTTGVADPEPADTEPWFDVAHAVVLLPVTLVTAVVTALWWFVGLGAGTSSLRAWYAPGSPDARLAVGTVVGVLLLLCLPLVTRACVAGQAGLGQALLWDASALRRRISGLERERDTARAQTVAAVTAEAAALARLERDIHDGPQQRLVRLAMELGRAQRHFDSRPEAVREAIADAIIQAQEALDELRALSRGIAPPILVDRGLREAVTALAARCTVPAEVDAGPLDGRLTAAVETAAYFVIAEALANVAKHSQADRCAIGIRHGDGTTVRVWVTDDGVGGAAVAKGHGLAGLEDRVRAAGGRLRIASPDGGPTTITAELPCR